METVSQFISKEIKERKLTKSLIYSNLKIHRTGFDYKLKNNNWSVEEFIHICAIMGADPCKYIKSNTKHSISIAAEKLAEQEKGKLIDTETKEFYERQIESLTQIILNLSKNGQS